MSHNNEAFEFVCVGVELIQSMLGMLKSPHKTTGWLSLTHCSVSIKCFRQSTVEPGGRQNRPRRIGVYLVLIWIQRASSSFSSSSRLVAEQVEKQKPLMFTTESPTVSPQRPQRPQRLLFKTHPRGARYTGPKIHIWGAIISKEIPAFMCAAQLMKGAYHIIEDKQKSGKASLYTYTGQNGYCNSI